MCANWCFCSKTWCLFQNEDPRYRLNSCCDNIRIRNGHLCSNHFLFVSVHLLIRKLFFCCNIRLKLARVLEKVCFWSDNQWTCWVSIVTAISQGEESKIDMLKKLLMKKKTQNMESYYKKNWSCWVPIVTSSPWWYWCFYLGRVKDSHKHFIVI